MKRMRKRGTSPCRAPYHRDRRDPAAAGVAVAVVGVGDVVGGRVGVVAEAAVVVVEQPESRVASTSRTWRSVSRGKSCWGRVGLVRPDLIRRRGTLQSAQRGHVNPGG